MSTNKDGSVTLEHPIPAAFGGAESWDQKMVRLRNRKPPVRSVTFYDEDATNEVDRLLVECGKIEARVRSEVAARISEDDPDLNADDHLHAVIAGMDENPEVIAARAVVTEAEEAADDATIVLSVQALPSDIWEELVAAHPATKQQRAHDDEYNITRFAPAAISACSVEDMTVEEAAGLVGGEFEVLDGNGNGTGEWKRVPAALNQGEAALLFTTVVGINQFARASMGKG